MNRQNSAYHFRMQSECEQTLVLVSLCVQGFLQNFSTVGKN